MHSAHRNLFTIILHLVAFVWMFLAFICEWNNDFAPFCTAHKTCSIFLSFALSLLLILVLFHIKKREYNKFLSFSMWNGFHFCKCFHFDNKNCTNYSMQADSKEQLKWCAFFVQPNEIRIKKNSLLRIFTEANDMNSEHTKAYCCGCCCRCYHCVCLREKCFTENACIEPVSKL